MMPAFFEDLKKNVLTLLEKSLPAGLTYHDAAHTADVMEQAERIAIEEGITDENDMLLLKTAALFHDTGFLYTYREHEAKGCEFAKSKLREWFDEDKINTICEMIIATKLPQTPLSDLAAILCDADLDYLGRDDFPVISNKLRMEFLRFGIVKDDMEWQEKQISFLKGHSYFTNNSRQLRESVKNQHLEKLIEIFLNAQTK